MTTLLLLVALALPGDIPQAPAPPQAPDYGPRIEAIEARLTRLEDPDACHCNITGICKCDPEHCTCPGCPKHKSSKAATADKPSMDDILSLYADHIDEINAIWRSLPEQCTLKDAVEEWQKRKENGGKTEKAFSAHKALIFSALGWCAPCRTADKFRREAGLVEGVDYEYIDYDTDKAAVAKYHITQIPALILLDGDTVKEHYVGADWQVKKIKAWMREGVGYHGEKTPSPAKSESRSAAPAVSLDLPDGFGGNATDAEIREHLVNAHGYSAASCAGQSRENLVRMHGAGHGSNYAELHVSRRSSTQSWPQPRAVVTWPQNYNQNYFPNNFSSNGTWQMQCGPNGCQRVWVSR